MPAVGGPARAVRGEGDLSMLEVLEVGVGAEGLRLAGLVRAAGLAPSNSEASGASSWRSFKGKAVDAVALTRQLNITHVLEGSVRKAGDRVRITAQLVDGEIGDPVWADRYDRDLTDIFAIQDEISKAIVGALKLTEPLQAKLARLEAAKAAWRL